MPPKKQTKVKEEAKSKKQKGFKIGKIVFSQDMPAAKKQLVQKLGQKVNLNGFRWELSTIQDIHLNFQALHINKHKSSWLNKQSASYNFKGHKHHKNISQTVNSYSAYNPFKLAQNLVSNIEELQFLDAPLLGRLDLRQNKITNLKNVKKFSFPKLHMFVFGTNLIASVGSLSQANFPQMDWYDFFQNPNLNDFQKLIKGCNKELHHCYFQNCSVLNSVKTKKSFRLRWNSSDIYIKTAMSGNQQPSSGQQDQMNQQI